VRAQADRARPGTAEHLAALPGSTVLDLDLPAALAVARHDTWAAAHCQYAAQPAPDRPDGAVIPSFGDVDLSEPVGGDWQLGALSYLFGRQGGFVHENRQHLCTSLGSTRSSAEIEQFMTLGSTGPC
jgi:hypothetical protein